MHHTRNYPSWLPRETSAAPTCIQVSPNIMEQMGIDPISKLAAAIEKLAVALNREGLGG